MAVVLPGPRHFLRLDRDVTMVVDELSSFDGHKEPERCTKLVELLKRRQHILLSCMRAILEGYGCFEPRLSYMKFSLHTQRELESGDGPPIWLSAEGLCGSGTQLGVLAARFLEKLERVRKSLRALAGSLGAAFPPMTIPKNVRALFLDFDAAWEAFEICYLSTLHAPKSVESVEQLQDVAVLFSETAHRALDRRILNQDMIDDCEPKLMVALPRLAVLYAATVLQSPLRQAYFAAFEDQMQMLSGIIGELSESEIVNLERRLCDVDVATPVPQGLLASEESSENTTASTTLPASAIEAVEHVVPISISSTADDTANSTFVENFKEVLDGSPKATHDSHALASYCNDTQTPHNPARDAFLLASAIAAGLQTSAGADLAHLLQMVFLLHRSHANDSTPASPSPTTVSPSLSLPTQPLSSASPPLVPSSHWAMDTKCFKCKHNFTFFLRRHHCRRCGRSVCGNCSSLRQPQVEPTDPIALRLCIECKPRRSSTGGIK